MKKEENAFQEKKKLKTTQYKINKKILADHEAHMVKCPNQWDDVFGCPKYRQNPYVDFKSISNKSTSNQVTDKLALLAYRENSHSRYVTFVLAIAPFLFYLIFFPRTSIRKAWVIDGCKCIGLNWLGSWAIESGKVIGPVLLDSYVGRHFEVKTVYVDNEKH